MSVRFQKEFPSNFADKASRDFAGSQETQKRKHWNMFRTNNKDGLQSAEMDIRQIGKVYLNSKSHL